MRARPKILLCTNYEEAWEYFEKYKDLLLGIISDIAFPKNGEIDEPAGIKFSKAVKEVVSDIPILLTSNDASNEEDAKKTAAAFILKDSPILITKLQHFMNNYFGFGDFVFKTADGIEVGVAKDLKSMEEQLKIVHIESIMHHVKKKSFF